MTEPGDLSPVALWACSDHAGDGRYRVGVHYGRTVAFTLAPDAALRYAALTATVAARALHMGAVCGQMRSSALIPDLPELLELLRLRQAPAEWPWPVTLRPALNFADPADVRPLVVVTVGGVPHSEIPATAVIQHAAHVLMIREAAELDTAYWDVLTTAGVPPDEAGDLVTALYGHLEL